MYAVYKLSKNTGFQPIIATWWFDYNIGVFDGCDRGRDKPFENERQRHRPCAVDKSSPSDKLFSSPGTQTEKTGFQHVDPPNSPTWVHARRSERKLLKETENEVAQTLFGVSRANYGPPTQKSTPGMRMLAC